jgi:hypothetical protein
MLFLHEVHRLKGLRAHEFAAKYREWMDILGKTDYARLIWYADHAHGTGPAYQVVSYTAITDGRAWEELARRLQRGDLHTWLRELDELRHDVRSNLLVPLHWSPIQEVNLDDVPTDGRAHKRTLVMEDTGWPSTPLDDYTNYWYSDYYVPLTHGKFWYEVTASFQPAFGAGLRPEAILWQKLFDNDKLMELFAEGDETSEKSPTPGSFIEKALQYRDQWVSKLLRVAPWSPLY